MAHIKYALEECMEIKRAGHLYAHVAKEVGGRLSVTKWDYDKYLRDFFLTNFFLVL